MKNIPYIHVELCTGCGICVDVCPVDVFEMSDVGKAVVEYPDRCMACRICEENCPTDAIEIKVLE
ncbi:MULTISPECIES: 4Fe-4S dicluster domain-containing protein [unclassified Desulfurobacterium]|uniref:4Fe-4S dicluster domain-containing protein n=1 Tax=unclassified Desulfurobacterium TaxID=2639089 RepID=UPI0003B76607|nr:MULTISPECIES: 4Fe-4S binding protein [unclassified Desulfurobacterium]